MTDKKMTVWALFDSGNGSYTKGVKALNSSGGANIDIYPIGIDIENKNDHFINLNLADYGRLFGDNTLFDTLTNKIEYDMQMVFRNQDAEPSLDENGDVFEPLYWLDIRVTPKTPTEYHTSLGVKREKRHLAELQKFFEFIENNKRNLFDLCGLRGELS